MSDDSKNGDAISRSQAIEALQTFSDETSRLDDPRGMGYSPDYWQGLDTAIGILESLASLPVVPQKKNDREEMFLMRLRLVLAAGHTAAYDLRADISELLNERRAEIESLRGAPVVPQTNPYKPCEPCLADDHDNCTGDCPSMCCALAAYEKAEVAPVVAGELTPKLRETIPPAYTENRQSEYDKWVAPRLNQLAHYGQPRRLYEKAEVAPVVAGELTPNLETINANLRRHVELARRAGAIPACQTNHQCLNVKTYSVAGQPVDESSIHAAKFCPDCGTSLESAPVEGTK
jgi:hypothetical protein